MKPITIKEEWKESFTNEDAVSLCEEMQMHVEWLEEEEKDDNLKSFYQLTKAAYGLINNPYGEIPNIFYQFKTRSKQRIERLKNHIFYSIKCESKREKYQRKITTPIGFYISKDYVFKFIDNYNKNLELYEHALKNKDEIFLKACKIPEDTEYIFKKRYSNPNYSKYLTFVEIHKDSDITDEIEFKMEDYHLIDWQFSWGHDIKCFKDIKHDKYFEEYLKAHYSEEYI